MLINMIVLFIWILKSYQRKVIDTIQKLVGACHFPIVQILEALSQNEINGHSTYKQAFHLLSEMVKRKQPLLM